MKRWIWLTLLLLALMLLPSCGEAGPTELLSSADLALPQVALGGPAPEAADLLTPAARERCAQQGITVDYEVLPDWSTLGEKMIALVARQGEVRQTLACTLTVVEDVTPPAFGGVEDLSVKVGEGLILRAGVTVSDDCFGEVAWEVDATAVDTSAPGLYSAVYIAKDAVGNETRQRVYVHVYAQDISQAQLSARVEPLLASLVSADATADDKCRAIHAYVRESISYFPVSDKSDYRRAAYDALFGSRRGDCYTYYAAARALLEAAGFETATVERTHAPGEETHIWLMVNLSPAGEEPCWLHFDATLIHDGGPANGGCLFTEEELEIYNTTVNPGFYDHDCSAHP